MPVNELRAITTFVRTAELGSLRRAAVAQGISPQAASQALAQLEQHLGVRLFHRTTRAMALTDEGRHFLEGVRPALGWLQRAMEGVRQAKDEIAGPLRIVGPRSAFRPALWALLDEFCTRHPDVHPEVQLADDIGNWVEDRVDVGFRVGASPAEGVIARRLFPVQTIICAAPAYLRRHGAPQSLDDLAAHRCSAFRHPEGRIVAWSVKVGKDVAAQPVVPALCINDEELEFDALLGGHVISMMTNITVAAHIRAGRLVPLLTRHVASPASLHVYWGSRSAQPARVRAFIDLAIERLADSEDFVLGAKELAAAEAKGREQHVRTKAR
ncbi:LysR family transcriptional regulator [Roseateles chitosanitabidus]|uniref:LysR family transcriptional regulator n=1 Tax=Roseateles chitosanitabidus TaxID=65048 RepID=UPI00082C4166|nr:LysR family transcriptional regulator [Roseateles chitosanitabidus]